MRTSLKAVLCTTQLRELIFPDHVELLVGMPSLTCFSLPKDLIGCLHSALAARSDRIDQELANFVYKRPGSKYVWLGGHMVSVSFATVT